MWSPHLIVQITADPAIKQAARQQMGQMQKWKENTNADTDEVPKGEMKE